MRPEKHLFSRNAFLGGMLRRKAIEGLFQAGSREAVLVLGEAVEKEHPEAAEILRRLLLLQHEREPLMHTAIWNYWKSRRFSLLLQQMPAVGSLPSEIGQALEAMPQSDWGNDMLFSLWMQSDMDALGELLESGGRHAPSLEIDALFGLVRGKADRYLLLEDPDYSIMEKGWIAASPSRRHRISMTVLKSQDPRLIAAYSHAVGEGHEAQLVIDALKLSGDHDGLFDRMQGLPFNAALALFAFWAEEPGRPNDTLKAALVEAAVRLYGKLSEQLAEARRSALPPGTEDIFLFWRERYRSRALIEEDLSSADPFRRAGALYSGLQRGMLGRERLGEIALNGSWPEKLALQYQFEVPDAGQRAEHVLWLCAQDNVVADMLSIRLPGTLEESARIARRLSGMAGEGPTEYQETLLQLLKLLQGHFLRGIITVDDSDDATETGAIEMEDVDNASW